MNIHYTPKAQQDLQDIKTYFESDLQNPSASNRILKEITQRIRTLEDFPKTGRKLSAIIGIETDYRFLGSGSYLIFYRSDGDDIYIGRIIHGRRDYIAILFGEKPLED